MRIKYVVTLDYHDYKFDNDCEAISFAKLAISGGRTRVVMTMDADEDGEETPNEETED